MIGSCFETDIVKVVNIYTYNLTDCFGLFYIPFKPIFKLSIIYRIICKFLVMINYCERYG